MTKLSEFRQQKINANRHTQRGRGLLQMSMQRDGYSAPMVAAKDGEIFIGSHRLEVAGEVFTPDVEPIIVESDGTRPVIVKRTDIETADDPKAKRLGIADNRVAQLSLDWDVDILKGFSLPDLDLVGFNANERIEFGIQERPQADAGPQIDRTAELLEKWQVKTGDLWQIGAHRLACGDCTDAATVARVMGGEKAGACVTDPPYNISKDTWDTIDNYVEWCKSWFDTIPEIPIFVFTGSLHCGLWWQVKPPRMVYCWHKPNGQGNNPAGGTTKWEPVLAWNIERDKQTDFIEHNNEYGEHVNALHLTPKPVGLFEKLAQKTIGIVVDYFLGSGTCLVACENLGRKCRAVEISPAYCAVALDRMATAFPALDIRRIE